MKLLRIRCENLRGVADGDYSFTQPDGRPHDISLIVGPAASGKTTLLEAIAMAKERVAPYGVAGRPRVLLAPGASNGRVELTLLLSDEERHKSGLADPIAEVGIMLSGAAPDVDPRLVALLRAYDHRGSAAIFDFFPADRRLSMPLGMEPPPRETDERRMRLRSDPDKYRGVVAWLSAQLLRRAGQLDNQLREEGLLFTAAGSPGRGDPLAGFRATLAEMCPWLRLDGLASDGATPMFMRLDGSTVPVLELSAAERDAVLLAGTLHRIRMSRSILLIDRPDLHAAPDDQLRWLRILAGAGNQVIAAATSERLEREIPAPQQIVLRRRGS